MRIIHVIRLLCWCNLKDSHYRSCFAAFAYLFRVKVVFGRRKHNRRIFKLTAVKLISNQKQDWFINWILRVSDWNQIPQNTPVVACGNLLVLLSYIGDDVCKILLPVHVFLFRIDPCFTLQALHNFAGIPDVKTWNYIPTRVLLRKPNWYLSWRGHRRYFIFLDDWRAGLLKFSFGLIYKPLTAWFRIALPKLAKALAIQLKCWQVKASFGVLLVKSVCLSAFRKGFTLKDVRAKIFQLIEFF